MIGFFPNPYPDELLYSLLCRYYVRTGYTAYIYAAEDLYSKHTVHPDIEFLNRFNDDALYWITKYKTLEEIIQRHTMFPVYARFLPKERKSAAHTALIKMEGNWRNLLAIPNTGERYLMFCPECAKEDREFFGETYWHRQHQIQRIRICPKHKCFLTDSKVKNSGRNSPGLYSAEQNIPYDTVSEYCKNDIEIELSGYMVEIMCSHIDIDKETQIGLFLHSKLPDKYLNKSGLVRNITKLFSDYSEFYYGLEKITEVQMQKIFNGYKNDFYSVCQLAFFEGVSVDELNHISFSTEPTGIESLYKELSDKHNIDYDTIKAISNSVLNYVRKSTVQKSCGPRAQKWNELDEKMLPQIKTFIDNLYKSTDRPKKLSFSLVQKSLNLPQKQIYKLPQCKKYIEEHMESQEQFWAREVEWAIKSLDSDGISWSKIQRLLNIRKVDLVRCQPYIVDSYTLEVVENILKDFN